MKSKEINQLIKNYGDYVEMQESSCIIRESFLSFFKDETIRLRQEFKYIESDLQCESQEIEYYPDTEDVNTIQKLSAMLFNIVHGELSDIHDILRDF